MFTCVVAASSQRGRGQRRRPLRAAALSLLLCVAAITGLHVVNAQDADNDGAPDGADACPESTRGSRNHVDDNGCEQDQIDVDGDGWCNPDRPRGPDNAWLHTRDEWCMGVDNCKFVYNPEQEINLPVDNPNDADGHGDACNSSECSWAVCSSCPSMRWGAGRCHSFCNCCLACLCQSGFGYRTLRHGLPQRRCCPSMCLACGAAVVLVASVLHSPECAYHACLCIHARVCACVRARLRARVHARVRARVRACAWACVRVGMCVGVCVCACVVTRCCACVAPACCQTAATRRAPSAATTSPHGYPPAATSARARSVRLAARVGSCGASGVPRGTAP
jgi:hypothetical protein